MKVNVNVGGNQPTPAKAATTAEMMPQSAAAPQPAAEPAPQPVATAAASAAPVAATAPETPVKPKRRLPISRKTLIILSALVVGAVTVLLSLQYVSAKRKLSQLQNPEEAAKVETEGLVRKVAKLAALPGEETPTVATVVDASKLKAQAFFASAENGDKVLMYTTAKKAYLYRPSTNQIIEIAPINLGQAQAQPQPSPEPTPPPPPAPKKK